MKVILQQVNRTLSRYNKSDAPSLWAFWHKWNYEHTLVKNVLQFSNQVMKELNKYHVFRWDWMVGLAGAVTGLVVTELEQLYYQIKIGYKPTTSNLVIKGVLRNQAVSNKLKLVLDSNVFTNQQIQFYVHQALLNQVLNPQKQTIKSLINYAIGSLNSPQNVNYFAGLIGGYVPLLNQPIKNAALQFLDSPTMDGLTASGLKSVLSSLFIKQFIASQMNDQIKNFLKQKKNSQYLYDMIKQKISF